jgi:hypothetical protein
LPLKAGSRVDEATGEVFGPGGEKLGRVPDLLADQAAAPGAARATGAAADGRVGRSGGGLAPAGPTGEPGPQEVAPAEVAPAEVAPAEVAPAPASGPHLQVVAPDPAILSPAGSAPADAPDGERHGAAQSPAGEPAWTASSSPDLLAG